jgi:hypothetical protein
MVKQIFCQAMAGARLEFCQFTNTTQQGVYIHTRIQILKLRLKASKFMFI